MTDTVPLPYETTAPLAIPADVFSNKGIAVVLITGGSYGGAWVLDAFPVYDDGPGDTVIGSIETDPAEHQPERALTAARGWLEEYCAGTPFTLLTFKSLNHVYGPREALFSASAQAVIAIPMP